MHTNETDYFCKMKFIPFFLFLIGIDLYFYFGNASFSSKFFGPYYKYFYVLLSVLAYGLIAFVSVQYDQQAPFKDYTFLKSIVFVLFSAKVLGLMPLLIDDLVRLFRWAGSALSSDVTFDGGRLAFLQKSSLLLAGALFSTLSLGMLMGRYRFKKNRQDVYVSNWPSQLDNFKLIHISDLHLGSFNSVEKLEEMVALINEEAPDMIVFTGDLVNNFYHEALPFVETLKKLKAKKGVFSILGNHDYGDYAINNRKSEAWKNNFTKLIELQKKAGFDLLLNEARKIDVNDSSFQLVGVENWGSGRFTKDGDLDKAMQGVNPSLPTILLSHDPSHWREVVLKSQHNIGLQLSGHTHGMQFGIEIPEWKWSPVQYRYKEWAGLYQQNESQLYVNRGVGHLGYAGRVGIMPDLSILSLRAKATS